MPDEGLAVVRRALVANPNNVVVLNQAGVCNMLCGDLDEAEASFRRAWYLSPGAPETYESLAGIGYALFFKRDFEGCDRVGQQVDRNAGRLAARVLDADRLAGPSRPAR